MHPPCILAPETALGALSSVALSSAQANLILTKSVYYVPSLKCIPCPRTVNSENAQYAGVFVIISSPTIMEVLCCV